MGKSVISKIFIKSAVYQKNLKLGVMIAWTISIVISTAIATFLEEFNFLAPISQRVHMSYQNLLCRISPVLSIKLTVKLQRLRVHMAIVDQ